MSNRYVPSYPKTAGHPRRKSRVYRLRLVGEEDWRVVDPDSDLITYRGSWLGKENTRLVAFIPTYSENQIICPASQVAAIEEDPRR